MAAGQERVLRRRIRSVNSTRKITRAMELIAASRIARAQHAIAAARPYVQGMTALLGGLADNYEARRHPIFAEVGEVNSVALVVIAADRGLCGAYNSNVLRTAERLAVSHRDQDRTVHLVLVGRKAQAYFRYRGYDVSDSFTSVTDKPSFANAAVIAERLAVIMGTARSGRSEGGESPAEPVGASVSGGGTGSGTDEGTSRSVDLVQIVYTKFRSLGIQQVITEQVFPVMPESHLPVPHARTAQEQAEIEAHDHRVGGSGQLVFVDYEFEPDAYVLLDTLVPRVVETRIYGALLDASASEHASRQRAMKAATDNADEFVKVLTRQMNRARQDSITTEIMEIVGGAEALSQVVTAGAAGGRPASLEERITREP